MQTKVLVSVFDALEHGGSWDVADELDSWQPLRPDDAKTLFEGVSRDWWVAGGWAIDLFVGYESRSHSDLDVLILRADQQAFREHLSDWDVHAANPPGTLRPWPIGETLPAAVHDVFCRPAPTAPWAFQFVIDDADGDDWVFRRDDRVRRPIESLYGRASTPALPVLVPDVQLLYKSRGLRERDIADFETAKPRLSPTERQWLREALTIAAPGHEWIRHLEE